MVRETAAVAVESVMAMNVELRGCGREGDKVTPEHLPFTIHRNGVVDMQRWDNELSRGGAIHLHFRRRPLRDCVLSGRHGGSPARALG